MMDEKKVILDKNRRKNTSQNAANNRMEMEEHNNKHKHFFEKIRYTKAQVRRLDLTPPEEKIATIILMRYLNLPKYQ